MGVRPPVFDHRSPYRDARHCLPVSTHLGQVPTVTTISGLTTIQGWVASPCLSSSLSFCVRFNAAVTRHAATLDTEPRAKSYSGGSLTHLSSNHFQYAHGSICYATFRARRSPESSIPIAIETPISSETSVAVNPWARSPVVIAEMVGKVNEARIANPYRRFLAVGSIGQFDDRMR